MTIKYIKKEGRWRSEESDRLRSMDVQSSQDSRTYLVNVTSVDERDGRQGWSKGRVQGEGDDGKTKRRRGADGNERSRNESSHLTTFAIVFTAQKERPFFALGLRAEEATFRPAYHTVRTWRGRKRVRKRMHDV